jgi:hypothetical protein
MNTWHFDYKLKVCVIVKISVYSKNLKSEDQLRKTQLLLPVTG